MTSSTSQHTANPGVNPDPGEIAKFDALASDWWNPQGPLWTLHAINPLRLRLICDQLELAGKRVVDIGCGGGLLCEAMAHCGARVTGIDLAPAALQAARQHASQSGIDIDYQQLSSAELANRHSGEFDLVCAMELLEHLPNPAALVADCARLVQPGGKVVFSTINRNLKAFVQAIVVAEHLLGIVPRGTHQYARLVRPNELAAMCRASGMRPLDSCGLLYNPVTKAFRLGRDVSVNYFVIAENP